MTTRFNLEHDGKDVQAIVRSGFGPLTHCRYLLLRIHKPTQVRAWIAQLLASGLIKTVADDNDGKVEEAVLLGFSYAGLDALGLTEHADFPFPSSFRNGMADPTRMALLGDRNRAWNWGDIAPGRHGEVHVLAAHYRQRAFDGPTALLDTTKASDHGMSLVKLIRTCPYYIKEGREPFGFKDGLAQPTVAELMKAKSVERRRDRGGASFEDDVVAVGEFVLGYANSYGERSYCPDVVGWESFGERSGARFARNGSYLAVRQIEQHVALFKQFDVPDREKMIGRTVDGKPLVTDPGSLPEPQRDLNDFRYRLGDFDGFECPRGAHVRRANPRDALGWDVPSGVAASKLHRLIRRGRVYTENPACGAGANGTACESADAGVGCGNGLFFIALNADLDRQFEFVQQRWFANSKFADLWDEADPALGDGTGRSFSIPGCLPVGRRIPDLPQFTTVNGGGYFFLPGISALEFIAQLSRAQPDMTSIADYRGVSGAQEWFAQPEVGVRPAPPPGVFEIGLSLAGTVSAGAYTAGVLDFLIEALDQWEQAKAKLSQPITQHSVRLSVIAGSSGGGACAATLAKALAYQFPPERLNMPQDLPHAESVNPLYRLWVYDFDVHDLCAVAVDEKSRPLQSLLHPGPLTNNFQDIAPSAAGERVEAIVPRAWVDNPLTVLLTLTNNSGVPYTVPYAGDSQRGQSFRRHADYARLEFYYGDSSAHQGGWPDAFAVKANADAVLPNVDRPGRPRTRETAWNDAWQFARATTAFPGLFPPVRLSRPAWHYLYQPVVVAASDSASLVARVFAPDWSRWNYASNGDITFVAIDGGTLNNSPVELARRHLAGIVGRNPRRPDQARRAVVHIDPFAPASSASKDTAEAVESTVAGAASALISHAQFSTQDFFLATEPEGRSRFLLSAVRRDATGTEYGASALAAGALHAFSGFLSERYQHHDFMLGRRNCQRFLREHFKLAADNPSFGVDAGRGAERPIIPLLGTAAVEQLQPEWPRAAFDLDRVSNINRTSVSTALRRRVEHVTERALNGIGLRGRVGLLLFAILPSFLTSRFLAGKLASHITQAVKDHRLSSS